MNRWLAPAAVILALLGFAAIPAAGAGPSGRGASSIRAQRESLNGKQAKAAAGAALRKRYGHSWRAGKHRYISCAQFSASTWRCRVSWRLGRASWGGFVRVISSDAGIQTQVHVTRR